MLHGPTFNADFSRNMFLNIVKHDLKYNFFEQKLRRQHIVNLGFRSQEPCSVKRGIFIKLIQCCANNWRCKLAGVTSTLCTYQRLSPWG